jgi:hypothetical protein
MDKIGLILNFIGSLLMAFSVCKNPGEAYQQYKGKKLYLACVSSPTRFRIGLYLLFAGFAFNILLWIINTHYKTN